MNNPASTILIVEDEPHMQMLIQYSLRNLGCRILAASSGEEALELLENGEKADLVIMDLVMGELNGFQTLERIRLKNAQVKIPFVILTARGQSSIREKAESLGVAAFFTKPFSPLNLANECRALLATGESRHSGALH